MSYITSIGIATPPNRFDQQTIATFMEKGMALDYESSRKLRTIFRASGIHTRYSVLDDFGRSSGFSFYTDHHDSRPIPSTRQRLLQYQQHALPLSRAAIDDCFQNAAPDITDRITHLIVVSCTGMYAPGLDIELVKSLGLRDSVQRTCINFMGCYAAFNALKVADAFCKAETNANVLVVCVELCTLHFQREGTEDNLLANALFADGAAAMLVSSDPRKGWNLLPERFHNALATTGQEHMAWRIGDLGFEMKLSSYVPDVIRTGIKRLTSALLEQMNKKAEDITFYAIHPGGKKILEAVEEELGVSKEQNAPAYSILSQYGNMSSVTVVFVLHHILHHLSQDDNEATLLSFAFGPGLTLESMLLKTEFHA
jgi:predicted naringenin-chalcone synthase